MMILLIQHNYPLPGPINRFSLTTYLIIIRKWMSLIPLPVRSNLSWMTLILVKNFQWRHKLIKVVHQNYFEEFVVFIYRLFLDWTTNKHIKGKYCIKVLRWASWRVKSGEAVKDCHAKSICLFKIQKCFGVSWRVGMRQTFLVTVSDRTQWNENDISTRSAEVSTVCLGNRAPVSKPIICLAFISNRRTSNLANIINANMSLFVTEKV